MADEEMQPVDDLTKFTDVVSNTEMQQEQQEAAPMYQVVGDTKLPVSKHRGKFWKGRLDQAQSMMKTPHEAWKESIRYYQHDQTRDGASDIDGSDSGAQGAVGQAGQRETENMVFANVSALVPMLYTKNPDAEFTSQSEDTKPLSNRLEILMKKLSSQKMAPGLNLKPKVKRNIVMTTLTNCAWFEVGYTLRDSSSEQALMDLQALSQEFVKAKSTNEIREIEGKLFALEGKLDLLSPSGPWCKVRRPWEVFVDPTATELDLSDANWVMVKDMIPTMLLRALYAKKSPEGEEWNSIYEPTHVLPANKSTSADNLTGDNFVLFSKEGSAKSHGFEDENAYKSAQMTCVYYVWDKATRRCEMYSDASWKWPIWVWDDPYHLDQFFPLVPMQFHTDPVRLYAKGEVTYYLDHQDALNGMNNEFARIRSYASSLIGYNKNVVKDLDIIEQILNGTYNKRSVPMDIPEGMKLSDVIGPILPPSAEVIKFFNKEATMQSIDRISGVSSVQRGVEYKTNTTNRAIESYESQQQTRADEKMDAIEESIGCVMWLVAQMCLQFMDGPTVAKLTGSDEGWTTLDPKDIPLMFTPRVVGGSSLKPSSRMKKEQAMQISQVVGQFSKATPAAAIVALKVLQEAFGNEVVISEQDWEMIMQGIQGQMQAQQAQPQPQGAGGVPPQAGPQQGAQPASEQGGGGAGMDVQNTVREAITTAVQLIDGMPPKVKQQIGVMLARQIPVQEIAAQIISKLEQPQG